MGNEVYKIAIESGIGGGSLSIIESGQILDYTIGSHRKGKSEHLIGDLSGILKKNKIDRSKIAAVIYSEYPGSQTGLKIGASIAKGLQLSLDTGIKSLNLFDCIYKNSLQTGGSKFLVILPVSKTDIIWKIYDRQTGVIETARANLEKKIEKSLDNLKTEGLRILLPYRLLENPDLIYEKFGLGRQIKTYDLGENLSGFLRFE